MALSDLLAGSVGACDYCGPHVIGEHKVSRGFYRDLETLDLICTYCKLVVYGRNRGNLSRRFWRTLEGQQIEITKMDFGHLSNTIRMLGEKLEIAQASGDRDYSERLEADLMALQDEFATRDAEIEQAQGIGRALFKSIGKKT